MSRVARVVAEIKLLPVYACSKCSRTETGDTIRRSIDCGSAEELKNAVDAIEHTSHHMPVGWSFNGQFTCQECKP